MIKQSAPQIFISHGWDDSDYARKLGEALSERGVRVWNAASEILPGDNWAEAISNALKKAKGMVVILSSDTPRSGGVQKEIEYALGELRFKDKLVPVVRGKSDFPWILRQMNPIRADKDVESVAAKVAKRFKQSPKPKATASVRRRVPTDR